MHTDPFLGWTTVDKVGYVVAEVSPYEADLDWGEITEPEEIGPVVELLGRATAKIHCVSDEDSDEDLVDFQTEDAIIEAIDQDPDAFVDELVDFGVDYAERPARTTPCSSTRSAPASSTWSRLCPEPAGKNRVVCPGTRSSAS